MVIQAISKKSEKSIIKKLDPRVPLSKPRILPLPESEWNDEMKSQLLPLNEEGRGGILNVHTTLVRHVKLFKRWGVFGRRIIPKSSLPPRDRELLILRTAWLCGSEYEWGQHIIIGKQNGLTDDEILRIRIGADAEGWNSFDAVLLRAVDELYTNTFISDSIWEELKNHYNTNQVLDLIFTVGQYNMLAMALNTLGVQLEEGKQGFP